MSDIDSKIQEILDKESIRDLVHLYCRAADRHDHVLMRELYHEDAYDYHGSFFKGKAMEFIDLLPEIQKSMGILHHNVTTHNIHLMGDKAEGETYILAFHQVLADDQSFDVLIGGRYFDEYEKNLDPQIRSLSKHSLLSKNKLEYYKNNFVRLSREK